MVTVSILDLVFIPNEEIFNRNYVNPLETDVLV